MKPQSRILPYPLLSIGITLLWLVIVSSYTVNSLVMGLIVGFILPLLTRNLMPDIPRVQRPGKALALFVLVCGDILLANLEVARLVLGSVRNLRPRFFTVPLDTADPFVATLLGSIVSLTPGTVSIDIDMQARTLHIHGLKVDNEEAAIASIKQRYEAPLKEIFAC